MRKRKNEIEKIEEKEKWIYTELNKTNNESH